MINKNFDLLGEQLAESGLEMSIDPGLIFGGISTATSLIGGLFGASQADDANRAQEKAYEDQLEAQEEAAERTNKYNKRKFEVDKENYYKQQNYNFDTAIKSWQYQTTLRALQEKTDAQKYLMNVKNSNLQLTYNQIAADQGYRREQLAMNDIRAEDAFNRQDTLVAQLQAEGKSRLGQAGRSMNKRVQADIAQIGRDIAVMDASLTGQIQASNLAMFDIGMGKYAADARVEAARMLRPEKLPDIPAPTKPPEPTWLEPMKVEPGFIAPPVPQSVAAPIIQGIGSAASGLASIDWNVGGAGGTAEQMYGSKGALPFSAGVNYYNR